MSKSKELVKEIKILTSCNKKTRKALSKESGVSSSCLDSWFSGRVQPSLSNLCNYLDAMGFELAIQRVKIDE